MLAVGLSTQFVPTLFSEMTALAINDGVVIAMLSALAFVSTLGLFRPLRMLPILIFELAWKLIWVLCVALPRWLADSMDDDTTLTLIACAWVIPFIFIIPWHYLINSYKHDLDVYK